MNLKHLLFILPAFLIFSFKTGYSQSAYFDSKVYEDVTSIPGNKTYHLKMSFPGVTIPLLYITINTANSQIYYGDTIPNIADHNSGTDTMRFVSYAINTSNLFDTVGTLYTTPKAKNVFFNSKMANTPGVCNGGLNFTVDTTQGHFISGTSFAGIMVQPSGSGMPYFCNVGVNNFNTLCEGEYAFGCYSLGGGSGFGITFHEYHTLLLGLNYMPVPSTMSVSINPYANAIGANCLGKARIQVSGGTPPYLYSYNNGLTFTNVDSISGLCDGVHLVQIADQQDTIAKNFIINTSANTTNNTNPFGTAMDTIIINHADCGFNYATPIDSAFISNYYFTSPTTLYVTFELWQAGNVTFVTDSAMYPFQNNTNYMIGLIIYCGSQKLASPTVFNGVRANDYIYYSGYVAGIKNSLLNNQLVAYPNPFNNELTLTANTIQSVISIETVNLIGEKVDIEFQKINSNFKANTEKLSKGIYFVSLLFENNQRSTFKIIKQ
ncbi:MAG: T9SS type A sorting domain-containing protein [Bacteroidota bacterium]